MKPHEPTEQTRQLVELLSLAGYPHTKIAPLIGEGISVPTLKLYYPNELNHAKARRHAALAGMAFQLAMGRPAKYDAQGNCIQSELEPNGTMVIFLSKTQLGWKETNVLEVSDPASTGALDRLNAAIDRVLAPRDGDLSAEGGAPAQAEPGRLN